MESLVFIGRLIGGEQHVHCGRPGDHVGDGQWVRASTICHQQGRRTHTAVIDAQRRTRTMLDVQRNHTQADDLFKYR